VVARLIIVVAFIIVAGSCSALVYGIVAGGGAGERIGNPSVYERIDRLSDCEALQKAFDTAMDNAEARQPGDRLRTISLAYAEYADDRMRDLGCYD
jgi:hypothetical protein